MALAAERDDFATAAEEKLRCPVTDLPGQYECRIQVYNGLLHSGFRLHFLTKAETSNMPKVNAHIS